MKIIKYKKVIYVIAIIFMIMYFLVSMNNNVIAGTGFQSGMQSGTTSAEETLKGIYTTPSDKAGFDTMIGNYLWVAIAIGVSTGVVMVAIIRVKYIIASPEGKADIKKQAFMYMIGAALIVSGATFVGIIANAALNLN